MKFTEVYISTTRFPKSIYQLLTAETPVVLLFEKLSSFARNVLFLFFWPRKYSLQKYTYIVRICRTFYYVYSYNEYVSWKCLLDDA